MTRRAPCLFLACTTLAAAALAADLPSPWRAWRYSRTVQGIPLEGRAPAKILLPWEIFPHCEAGCRDIRLIEDQGQEVPFELYFDKGNFQEENHATRIMENSFVADHYTQIIADAGEKTLTYDRVRVLTPKMDFIVWAELAMSDDARTWRIVEPRAPISRFHSKAIDGTQTIPFRGLGLYARYVRIRIFERASQFPVTGIEVLYENSRPPDRVPLMVSLLPESASDSTESRWRGDLASQNIPLSEVTFTTDQPEFYRAVRIETSNDGKGWEFRGSGEIYRFHQADKLKESLRISFPEVSGERYLRVSVVNDNDQPLSKAQVEVLGVPRKILFREEPGRSYRLIYGNVKAGSPQYDLGHYLDVGTSKPAYVILQLGSEELISNYADPRPFTERHPNVLWFTLGIAVVLLGYTALRALRSPSPNAP